MTYDEHLRQFEEHRARRATLVEHWPHGGNLPRAVVRSVQRFQAGEDGDGASLLAKSATDPAYLAAVRLFVAEEQNHARLLKNLLAYAGEPTIDGHWTDTVFVAVRRAMGLRLELMTLMLAEVVALRYYLALRDGTGDPLVTDVAGRILADERRHVPFHIDRLRAGFGRSSRAVRMAGLVAWWTLMTGATLVVAADHGPALGAFGVSRRAFVRDVLRSFAPMARQVFLGAPVPPPTSEPFSDTPFRTSPPPTPTQHPCRPSIVDFVPDESGMRRAAVGQGQGVGRGRAPGSRPGRTGR